MLHGLPAGHFRVFEVLTEKVKRIRKTRTFILKDIWAWVSRTKLLQEKLQLVTEKFKKADSSRPFVSNFYSCSISINTVNTELLIWYNLSLKIFKSLYVFTSRIRVPRPAPTFVKFNTSLLLQHFHWANVTRLLWFAFSSHMLLYYFFFKGKKKTNQKNSVLHLVTSFRALLLFQKY